MNVNTCRPNIKLFHLSLVHTYATRHDTTACDTTGQRTKARRFFSLVPHIHDTTMRLDSDSLQTPLQFRGVHLITRLHKRTMLLQMKIRVRKDRHLSTQVFVWILNFLSKKTNPKVLVEF